MKRTVLYQNDSKQLIDSRKKSRTVKKLIYSYDRTNITSSDNWVFILIASFIPRKYLEKSHKLKKKLKKNKFDLANL